MDRHKTILVNDCVSVPSDYFGKDYHKTLQSLGFTRIYGRIVEVLEETHRFAICWDLDQQVTHDHKLGTVRMEAKSTPCQTAPATTASFDQSAIIAVTPTNGPCSSNAVVGTHAIMEEELTEPGEQYFLCIDGDNGEIPVLKGTMYWTKPGVHVHNKPLPHTHQKFRIDEVVKQWDGYDEDKNSVGSFVIWDLAAITNIKSIKGSKKQDKGKKSRKMIREFGRAIENESDFEVHNNTINNDNNNNNDEDEIVPATYTNLRVRKKPANYIDQSDSDEENEENEVRRGSRKLKQEGKHKANRTLRESAKGKRSLEEVVGEIKSKKAAVETKRESKRVLVSKATSSHEEDNTISVNEVLDKLNDNSKWAGADIFICPPGGNRSDEDSAPSDDDDQDDEGRIHHLSRNQLLANCELQVQMNAEDEVRIIRGKEELSNLEKELRVEKTPYKNKWEKIAGENEKQKQLREIIDKFEPPRNEHLDNLDMMDHNWTHVRTFELIFDDELIDSIIDMTNRYAMENNANGWITLDRKIMRCFLGIMILSGYVRLPSYKMLWEEQLDVQQKLVKESIPRNHFRLILQNLHFCINSELEEDDKCAKVRPLLQRLRTNIQKNAVLTKEINVDESMIPYFGKFGNRLKQRMPLKPIRSGYKVWCLNLQGGYLYDFEVYQGKGSKNEFSEEFGLGPSVVLGLIKSLTKGHIVFVDNYFTNIPLMRHMLMNGFGLVGTFRADRIQDCPLPSKSDTKKKAKGYFEGQREQGSGVELIVWNDNGPVTVGSNIASVEPVDGAKRWSQEKKEYVIVPRPHMITLYNKSMGGTDQMDQQLATYRPFIRNRKWYWPFFTFSLGVALYNSWLLYRMLQGDCTYLDHLRAIARSYIRQYSYEKHIHTSTTRRSSFHNSRVAKRVDPSIRYDGKNHLLDVSEKTRCALCGKTVQKKCVKCGVNLHDRCFSAFHGLTL